MQQDSNVFREKLLTDYLDSFDFNYKNEVHDMIHEIIRLASHNFELADLNIIRQSIKELRKSYKIFAPYRDTRKVSVFGSARCLEDNLNYQLAMRVAKKVTEMGYMVITGAGGGIMEAGNRGSVLNRDFGVNIDLPMEQDANEYIRYSNKLASFKYFFNRKLIFVKESDAALFFPGGFGTHDEAFELLTLIQTGRCAPRPLIFLNYPDSTYWNEWFDFVRQELLDKSYISDCDMHMVEIVDNEDECAAFLKQFYRSYHSIRYIDDRAVMRLNRGISATELAQLESKFNKCDFHSFAYYEPFKFEPDDSYPEKHRLVFDFSKHNYGDLYALIHAVNSG